jgi:predicted ArsR family transcriptional regulator
MKGQSLTESDKKFILDNKDKMFNNQIAVALFISQTCVRKHIQKLSNEKQNTTR